MEKAHEVTNKNKENRVDISKEGEMGICTAQILGEKEGEGKKWGSEWDVRES